MSGFRESRQVAERKGEPDWRNGLQPADKEMGHTRPRALLKGPIKDGLWPDPTGSAIICARPEGDEPPVRAGW